MKIVNVNPGLLPIPPNGWGAIEKIIWEIHQNLKSLGHDSHILYTDEIVKDQFDAVHVHVANLANILHQRGIPYIFSFHDHHAFLYGKDSFVFKENYEAMKNSLLTLVPAKFLVDYFDLPNVVYFSHGVNTNIFSGTGFLPKNKGDHRLLCVANNGWAGDPSADRKGFSLAIQAAKDLNLPLTIAGPSNNKKYFEANPPDYNKLKILYDLSEQKLIQVYLEHSIFLHPSILEAGHPNLTLLEAMSCGLPPVCTFEEDNDLTGSYKIERSLESLKMGINYVISDYDEYKQKSLETAKNLSWKNRTLDLLEIYKKYNCKTMRNILIENYENTDIVFRAHRNNQNSINFNFVGNPKVEINGNIPGRYRVEFIDDDNNNTVHTAVITNNMWTNCSIKYCKNWKIVVTPINPIGEPIIHRFNPTGKRVYVALESSSLGDTLAWVPMVEEFRKKWDCNLVCSTFRNEMFESVYPEIEFVKPGNVVNDLYAMFNIGWYYFPDGKIDYSKIPVDFKTIPLQGTASDILNIPHKEIAPRVDKRGVKRNIEGKYVCIGPHGSALAKYWNRPGGWQKVIDFLNSKGYKVVYISSEPLNNDWHDSKLGGTLKNVIDKSGDLPILDRLSDLCFADYFIGIGSGLSWLAWAAGTKLMMISGFSKPFTEFNENCDRIFKENVCNGCFNTHQLDPGDWRWCPIHKGNEREFECTKSISEDEIIKILEARL
jgi:autotransporter strand-loop-strand O-heptosyltransferase